MQSAYSPALVGRIQYNDLEKQTRYRHPKKTWLGRFGPTLPTVRLVAGTAQTTPRSDGESWEENKRVQ